MIGIGILEVNHKSTEMFQEDYIQNAKYRSDNDIVNDINLLLKELQRRNCNIELDCTDDVLHEITYSSRDDIIAWTMSADRVREEIFLKEVPVR
jgi:hypothetical protein